MKIVLLGIQGAGKSTQGNLLSTQLGLPYLSTGHIFREIAKEKTPLGRFVKETINSGHLVPDEKTIAIVEEYLEKDEYAHGYILDGFPRTLRQAEHFKGVDKVIHFELSDREALWRIAARTEERDDNTLEAIKKRIEIFHTVTEKVVDYYKAKGKLYSIDAGKSIEEVNAEILKHLGKQFKGKEIKTWLPSTNTLIALVGLPGSGKSEAAEYLKNKGLAEVSFSAYGNQWIDEHGWKHTEKDHKKMRLFLRKKYGQAAFAILNKPLILNAFAKNKFVIVTGMRSWEEYEYLKKELEDVRIVIIALWADKKTRWKRIKERKTRSTLGGEERDLNELLGLNMGPTIAWADYMIINSGTREKLQEDIEEVYRKIYYSS